MERNYALDNLKSFTILVVLAHHSASAYPTFAVFDFDVYTRSTAPIVDHVRSIIFDYFILFNDVYFMQLMFFVSGLFTLSSLYSHGAIGYLKNRVIRLGIPAVVMSLFLMPMAYFPSWLLSGKSGFPNFIFGFYTGDTWPSGPSWFLWTLLFFCLVASLIQFLLRRVTLSTTKSKHILFFVALSSLCYVPMMLYFTPFEWSSVGGPFDFQSSRLVLYFLWFLFGASLGKIPTQFFSKYARAICLAMPLAIVSFYFYKYTLELALSSSTQTMYTYLSAFLFNISSCAIIFSFVFLFHTRLSSGTLYWRFLSKHAFALFVFHYPVCVAIQYVLVDYQMNVHLKFLTVFFVTLTASFLLGVLTKRVPVVRHIA